MPPIPQIALVLAASILTTVSAQLFLKKGVLSMGNLNFSFSNIFSFIFRIIQNGWLMTGLFFFGISFLIWIFILSKLQLNMAYPVVVSINFCLITLASWLLFKEYLGIAQILGIAAIIFGVFLVLFK